jgi:hypothetical protein
MKIACNHKFSKMNNFGITYLELHDLNFQNKYYVQNFDNVKKMFQGLKIHRVHNIEII